MKIDVAQRCVLLMAVRDRSRYGFPNAANRGAVGAGSHMVFAAGGTKHKGVFGSQPCGNQAAYGDKKSTTDGANPADATVAPRCNVVDAENQQRNAEQHE